MRAGHTPNPMTDDAKLIDYLVRSERAELAWRVAEATGVDVEYAEQALARMVDEWWQKWPEPQLHYPIIRRWDLGPDVYEAVEDSARSWSR